MSASSWRELRIFFGEPRDPGKTPRRQVQLIPLDTRKGLSMVGPFVITVLTERVRHEMLKHICYNQLAWYRDRYATVGGSVLTEL